MRDSIKTFVQDSLDSLAANPILKGVVPTMAGAGVTFLEEVEVGLRIASVSLAVIIGCLTMYVKWGEAVGVYKARKKQKQKE